MQETIIVSYLQSLLVIFTVFTIIMKLKPSVLRKEGGKKWHLSISKCRDGLCCQAPTCQCVGGDAAYFYLNFPATQPHYISSPGLTLPRWLHCWLCRGVLREMAVSEEKTQDKCVCSACEGKTIREDRYTKKEAHKQALV